MLLELHKFGIDNLVKSAHSVSISPVKVPSMDFLLNSFQPFEIECAAPGQATKSRGGLPPRARPFANLLKF